jgi:MerR family copper efflux transcriptional regulator
MQIGQLAQAAGVAIDTVRYYERQGLLPAPARRGSYRNYQAEDVLRMRFIRRAKGLGFSLEEIAGLLQLSAHRNDDMAGLKQAAQARLSALEDRIAELERVRSALKQLVKACPGHGDLATCPILAALSEESL